MSKSSDYWRKREEEWLAQIRKSEKAQAEEVQAIYDYMLDEIEKEINSFFEKYAAKEGISMAEAKKRASTIDIEAYMRKAAKYVKEKDFSEQANKEMLLYNMTMKVNRLELLKSSIGLDLVAGHDELKTYMGEKLTDHAVETLRHNAAILGPTIMNDADRKAKTIVNSSFHNATFSDRIWQHQDKLRNEMTNILTTALIGGRNPKEFIPNLRKRFDVSARDAERLLRTELARVQTEAQKESYKDENIEEYEYIACGLADCCDICRALDGKHFKLSKMVVGENAPPMHPNCHCSTGPYIDRKEYDEWLDSYKDHGLNFEEWKEKRALHENKKGPITVITESAINRVPLMKLTRLTEKEAKKLQAIHKRLLEESRVHNQSNEVGYKMTPDFKPKETKYGSDDKLIFSSVSISPKTYVAHNHPRNNSYSINDLLFFYENEDVQLLTIVKNNGNIELLDKANFDKGKFKTLVRRNIKKYTSNKGEIDYDKVISQTLKEASKKGLIEWMKS